MTIDIATAQNNPSKHEISLSYGVLPANELIDVLSIIVTAPLIAITGTYDSKSYSGAVTLSVADNSYLVCVTLTNCSP